MLRIAIDKAELARLIRLSRKALPEEACGLLGGIWRDGRPTVWLYPVENRLHSPTRFAIVPDQLTASRAVMRKRGQELCGCYHSHPTEAPVPSILDHAHASVANLFWIIHSPRHRLTRAFFFDGRRFANAALVMTEGVS